MPEFVIIFIHGTPGSRFSLTPGSHISPGTKIKHLDLGEYKSLGITILKKIKPISQSRKVCKDYGIYDSQAKCLLDSVILPNFRNETDAFEKCKIKFQNLSKICEIPQAKNILKYGGLSLNKCQTVEEYRCMLSFLKTEVAHQPKLCPGTDY